MKLLSGILLTLGLLSSATLAQASSFGSILINFNNDLGQAPDTTQADVIAAFQDADSNITTGIDFFAINNNGVGTEDGFVDAQDVEATATGLTFSTVGTPVNDGLAVPSSAHNYQDPLLGSNLYDTGGGDPGEQLGVTFSGLAALDAGLTVTLTAYGIGDNLGQQVQFNALLGDGTEDVFGNDPEIQSGLTRFNAVGEQRNDSTGTVPFVQFTFTTNGTDDVLQLLNTISPDPDTDPGGNGGRTHINAVSLSVSADTTAVPIPEPVAFFTGGLGLFFLTVRRRSR